jgi:hypothetical protein
MQQSCLTLYDANAMTWLGFTLIIGLSTDVATIFPVKTSQIFTALGICFHHWCSIT